MLPPLCMGSWLVIVLVIVLLVWAISSSRRQRQMDRQLDPRVCQACGANQPAHAKFCRQCGQRLE